MIFLSEVQQAKLSETNIYIHPFIRETYDRAWKNRKTGSIDLYIKA